MAKFPEYTEVPLYPIMQQRIRFKTIRAQFESEGAENRKQKWLYPRRDTILQYVNITKADAITLWQFYIARKGSFESFNFFVPEPELTYPSYTGEYVGTGDGSTEVFNLPCKSSSGRTVYVGGEAQSASAYNFTAGGGADGADLIQFNDSDMEAPTDGTIITIDFTGVLKVHSVFADDYLDFDTFLDRICTMGIELRGLLNE